MFIYVGLWVRVIFFFGNVYVGFGWCLFSLGFLMGFVWCFFLCDLMNGNVKRGICKFGKK